MATYSDVQSAIDNDGYFYFDKGTHTITQKIVLDGANRVRLVGHPQANIVWTGSSSDAPFVFDQDVANPKKIMFEWLTVSSAVSGSPIFKINSGDDNDGPDYLTMSHCDFTVLGAYAVEIWRSPYIITPCFRYMKTAGSGAIRLKANKGGSDPYHATSQMEITGWHHTGSNRVGPAFDLRGTSGLRMTDTFDTGDPSLIAALQSGGWEGPVSFRLDAPRTPAVITNHRIEYSENFDNASGCFLNEIRTDAATGPGKQNYVQWRNGTIRDSNIDSGVKPFRVMGGETRPQDHALVVDFLDCEDLSTDDFLFGGKLWARAKRTWVNPGNESAASALETLFNSTYWYSGTMSDTIYTDTDRIPSNSNDGGDLYQTGLDLYDDWEAAAGEYEEYL